MKKEFIDYLNEIGLTGAVVDRVKEIYKFYSEFLKFDIKDIFVSEYINPDGSRTYENLWFFNDTHIFEAKQFITEDDFDSDFFQDQIISFNINKKDFVMPLESYNENSRVTLTFYFNTRAGVLKASKINCNKLAEITNDYVMPNFQK